MRNLWEPREDYKRLDPQSLDDLRRAAVYPEEYIPYNRLYENLTQNELLSLIQDAKRLHWEVLDLCLCGLDTLPDALGALEDLRVLAVGNYSTVNNGQENTFSLLPDSFGSLASLQSLDLSYTNIRALPDSFSRLASLQSLNLSATQISALPDSFSRLASLQSLYLGATQIRALPDSFSRLASLQSLNLSGTQISALPDSFSRLASLQSLSLSVTKISALPDSFSRLASLQSLDLRNTQISALPDSFSRLASLQSLDLSVTKISALPDSITQLKNLKTLDLSGCHLTKIPYSLVQLGIPFVIDDRYADNCINLTDVTLGEGDLTLFSQPREVIEAAYRDQVTEAVRECKVIFLGDGAAGKSSLIERIVNGGFHPGALPTDGVKMTNWPTTLHDKPFVLRFLDFGGQEIMHSMHRCFLTAHTVYVIVCESRNDTEIDSTAARWLETVRAFSPDCPVILALNKWDVNPHVSVNERNLKERNPQLKRVLKTSAAVEPDHKYGVRPLLDEIMELVPGCISRIAENRNMLAVKRRLENMTEDYITSEQYRAICAENQIEEESLQYQMLNYLKDLGVAYSYDPEESEDLDSRLEKIRVLNPEWLTNGIYRLILRTEGGFLTMKTIRDTLRKPCAGDTVPDKTYTKEETEFIINVMRKFEISRYLEDGVEMIPLKLPKETPESVDSFQKENALHLRWKGEYLPNNLIHRLLIRKARTGELDTACVWRTGGRFTDQISDCTALAEMNENRLDVYVSGGRDCRRYLDTFRKEIQDILTQLNLKPEEIICCTVDGHTGSIAYEDVLRQYYDGRDTIYIRGIPGYLSPAELLRDTYYHWENEGARYREDRMRGGVSDSGRGAAKPEPPAKPEPSAKEEPENTADNLDQKVKLADIALKSSEALKNRLQITAWVALAILIPWLLLLFPDQRDTILEWLFSLFH